MSIHLSAQATALLEDYDLDFEDYPNVSNLVRLLAAPERFSFSEALEGNLAEMLSGIEQYFAADPDPEGPRYDELEDVANAGITLLEQFCRRKDTKLM